MSVEVTGIVVGRFAARWHDKEDAYIDGGGGVGAQVRVELGFGVEDRRQIEEPLHLDSIAGTHVTDVVEVRWRRYHLGAAVVVPVHHQSTFEKLY